MSMDKAWQRPSAAGMTETLAKAAESITTIVGKPKVKSEEILEQANKIIHSDRAQAYGSAEESFGRIANLWGAYLGRELSSHDVAMLMVLLKVSRAQTDHKDDTYIDIAGYGALASRLH